MSESIPEDSRSGAPSLNTGGPRAVLDRIGAALRLLAGARVVETALLAIGGIALLGWMLHLQPLASFTPSGPKVDFESALALLSIGAGLIAARKGRKRTALGVLVVVLLITLLGLCRVALGAADLAAIPALGSPLGERAETMPIAAAVGFLLAASGLMLRRRDGPQRRALAWIATPLLAVGLTAATAAVLALPVAFGSAYLGDIPLSTALALCWLALTLIVDASRGGEADADLLRSFYQATLAIVAAITLLLGTSFTHALEATRMSEKLLDRKLQLNGTADAVVAARELDGKLALWRRQADYAQGRGVFLLGAAPLLGFLLAGCGYALSGGLRRRIAALESLFEERVAQRTRDLGETIAQLEGLNRRLAASENAAQTREGFLRAVLSNSPVVLWAVDLDGVYTLREGKGLTAFGQQPGHGVGRREAELRSESPQFAQNVARALKGEVFSAEYTLLGRWLRTRYAPLKDDKGDTVGVVGVSTDITDRKEADQKAISEESARQATRLKSEFLASMSHEIRTPMNGIVGMAGLLSQTPLSDEQQGMLDVIQNSADALLSAVNDILDLSRLEAGKLALEESPFDFRALVEDALALLGPKAYEKGLELINDFDASMRAAFVGDEGRIRQVLNNLAGNAIKFSNSGHVLVRVRRVRQSDERTAMRIEVIDTGVGIAPEAQRKLLAPFTPEERNKARKVGSAGLGLAIAKQLIELMGGRLGLTSEVGSGSNFWFEFELRNAPEAPERAVPNLPAGTRVLVLDDNEICRGILALRLGARGALVDVSGDCVRAFDQCRAMAADGKPYAAIVADRYLVRGDAVQFARNIRAAAALADTAIVLLSPLGAPRDAALDGLFQAIEAKPVRERELVRAIASSVGRRRQSAVTGAAASGVARPQSGTLRILVAEDNVLNQKVTRTMASKLGHKVDVACDGAEALRLLEAGDYDVILMDCQMPNVDGYEATRRVRASGKPWSGLRIIAVTANATTADRQLCFDSGMDDFITKPLRAADLEAALGRFEWPVRPA